MFVVVAKGPFGNTLVFGPFRTQARASGEGLNIFGPLVFDNPVKWSVHRMMTRWAEGTGNDESIR